MLHDVQRILGIGIEGSLPAEPSERVAGQYYQSVWGAHVRGTAERDIHQWLRQRF